MTDLKALTGLKKLENLWVTGLEGIDLASVDKRSKLYKLIPKSLKSKR